jgi:hypothetical protein
VLNNLSTTPWGCMGEWMLTTPLQLVPRSSKCGSIHHIQGYASHLLRTVTAFVHLLFVNITYYDYTIVCAYKFRCRTFLFNQEVSICTELAQDSDYFHFLNSVELWRVLSFVTWRTVVWQKFKGFYLHNFSHSARCLLVQFTFLPWGWRQLLSRNVCKYVPDYTSSHHPESLKFRIKSFI